MNKLSSKLALEELQEAFLAFHSNGIHFLPLDNLSEVLLRIGSSRPSERQRMAYDEVQKIIGQVESRPEAGCIC